MYCPVNLIAATAPTVPKLCLLKLHKPTDISIAEEQYWVMMQSQGTGKQSSYVRPFAILQADIVGLRTGYLSFLPGFCLQINFCSIIWILVSIVHDLLSPDVSPGAFAHPHRQH